MVEQPVYADGAEDEVLSRLRRAADVSAGSAELARALPSWELIYHFSPQRTALLAPIELVEGTRVLDFGCGSGVLTRAMGELGAGVVGVEGTPTRAEAARERCRDLPNVRIVDGGAEEIGLNGPFDLALLCGVLEYSSVYGDGPEALLEDVVGALEPGGALVLAIENKIGLGYLTGRPEDHHGKSWVGLADYPRGGARTWPRAELAELLANAGLTAQRWMLPYPDYKLPRVIVDADVHGRGDAVDLVDKLVRDPLYGAFGGTTGAVPGRSLHRTAVVEGFGASVSPSFLVVAARTPEAVRRFVRPGLGWLVNSARLPRWRRSRVLTTALELRAVEGAGAESDWLRQEAPAVEPLLPGRPLDSLLLEALARGDEEELRGLLGLWRSCCEEGATGLGDQPRHPFLPGAPGVPVLAANALDVHPGNVVLLPDGSPRRIDLEWCAGEGVDAELVLVRALLEFAREVHRSGAPHPWEAELTTAELTLRLCGLVGLAGRARERWSELLAAEARLQELVSGTPSDEVLTALLGDVDRPGPARAWELPPLTQLAAAAADREHLRGVADELRGDVARAEDALDATRRLREEAMAALAEVERLREEATAEAAHLRRAVAKADEQLGDALMLVADAESERVGVERELAERSSRAEELAGENARLRTELDRLASSSVVRAGNRYLWPAARLVRGARDLALGRGGEEPDRVLRGVGKVAPSAVPLLAGRVRRVSERDAGLRYQLSAPSEVPVGLGQVVDLDGWAVHDDLPVRAVSVELGGRVLPATSGHPRPDVAAALGVHGWTGFRVRLPVRAGAVRPVLLVELADATVLRRELPELVGVPHEPEPVAVDWPGEGPRIAVCLATYNAPGGHFHEQVQSIKEQTHSNWVCLISDDGSTDKAALRSATAGDPRFVVVEHAENVGFYRNFGRALAMVPVDADLVALSDQDDVWDADKLAVMAERFADPSVQLAYCDMRLVDGGGAVVAESAWTNRPNQWTDLEQLLLLNTVTGAATVLRADLLRERVLPLPPGTPAAYHDQWIAATALAVGRIEFVDRALQSYRQHGANVTGWQVPRLADGLPGLRGLAAAGAGVGHGVDLLEARQAELDHITEHELRRIAQFSTVLLMRNQDLLSERETAKLERLAGAERRLWPLVRLALEGEERPETAGAERRLLAAALLRRHQQ
ncbi:glycosyltransferase [Actinosynnema mirum]|uniref:Glycosyl transferase family 2 n=1 Tax=Actinosynnema mirum (strain ATCC 29888 / DSM 43827 / JCM 3225 / NBRC 14064 / NCIMB 13271 / NRRL B-12336 / IMRU 3971 / 101) TaxID=446462 RepID=C6WDN4_ACTMD|nr:glycosyltransferase [Actinosynnema mirum]ACU34029.1 glycosyl transferase family 2 [Actinosynnema mirum DSM 43827]